MSDSEDSTVTYAEVSSPFEDLSDIGSPGVDGLPMMLEDPYVEAALQAPPYPDYVSGPEYSPSPVYVPYVPEPVYPEFMPLKNDVLPAEEQPLPAAISHTADSPGYITESDPEEDPEEDDKDLEEDPANYLDDKDDDDDEEEEAVMIRLRAESPSTSHPLPLPSPIVLPHTRASVAMMRAAAPSTYILASRSETPPSGTPPLLPIPLPTPSPPLVLPSTIYRAGVFDITLPPQKRLCIALGLRFEFGESSSASTVRPIGGFRADYGFVSTLDDEIRRDPEREVGYRIIDTWDEMVKDIQGTPAATDVAGLSQRMTDFVTTVRQDTARFMGDLMTHRMIGESTADYCINTTDQDQGVAGNRPQEIDTTHKGTDTTEDTADTGDSTPESAGTR
ncbi:hypothetical protein Tco_0817894 [Tanacetum coccineum]